MNTSGVTTLTRIIGVGIKYNPAARINPVELAKHNIAKTREYIRLMRKTS